MPVRLLFKRQPEDNRNSYSLDDPHEKARFLNRFHSELDKAEGRADIEAVRREFRKQAKELPEDYQEEVKDTISNFAGLKLINLPSAKNKGNSKALRFQNEKDN